MIDRNNQELNAYVYQQPLSAQMPERVFYYFGRKSNLWFLEMLYNLDKLPSDEATSFRDEIIKHTVQNDDFEYGWVFNDCRLQLDSWDDEILLKYLCQMFHPIIRSEESDWVGVHKDINNFLKVDGYEMYEVEKISGRSVYSYRYCI